MQTLNVWTMVNRGRSEKARLNAARVSPDWGWDAWIEPEDFEIVESEGVEEGEEYAKIQVKIGPNDEALIKAYRAGEKLCYDEDSENTILSAEDGGCPELEIFWAISYRGGLGVC